jgi:catechol 2,3-dioxygenase-like lactoylglutathione lyase family enzyme
MRLDHVGVLVDDLPAACAVARDVLGLGEPVTQVRVQEFGLTAAFFGLGAGRLELVRFDEPGDRLRDGEGARIDHIAVEVDDLGATAQRLRARGVRFQEPVRTAEVHQPVEMRGRRHLWTVPQTSGGIMWQLTEALPQDG